MMKKYLQQGKEQVEQSLNKVDNAGGGSNLRFVSEEMKKAILTALANGLSKKEACHAMGIHESWMSYELKKNEQWELDVNKAIESFKLYHLNNLSKHSQKHWQASAWLLERNFPERFNPRIAFEMASKAKPQAAPKWFGEVIEDIEIISEQDGQQRDTKDDDGASEKEEAKDQAAKSILRPEKGQEQDSSIPGE